MGFEVQGAQAQLRQKGEHVSVNLPGLYSSRQELLHHRGTSGSRAPFRTQLAEHMAQLVQFINRYNRRRLHRIGVALVDDEAFPLAQWAFRFVRQNAPGIGIVSAFDIVDAKTALGQWAVMGRFGGRRRSVWERRVGPLARERCRADRDRRRHWVA